MPDVHVVWDGKPFWMELKISKTNAVNVSPQQVAWNMAYWSRGGSSFYLVKAPSTSLLYLFEGDQGPNLVSSGLSGSEGREFDSLAALWEYLAARLAA